MDRKIFIFFLISFSILLILFSCLCVQKPAEIKYADNTDRYVVIFPVAIKTNPNELVTLTLLNSSQTIKVFTQETNQFGECIFEIGDYIPEINQVRIKLKTEEKIFDITPTTTEIEWFEKDLNT